MTKEEMEKGNQQKQERKYYTAGEGKPPIFIQSIIAEKRMTDIDFFYFTDMLDWSKQGDDMAVLEPLIACLAQWGDELIFAFDDKMTELLYSLDSRAIANSIYKDMEHFSGDEFLYIRCTALVNGKPHYNAVLKGRRKLKANMEFEAILYVPMLAWARRHGKDTDDYSHATKLSYETGSNEEGWRE